MKKKIPKLTKLRINCAKLKKSNLRPLDKTHQSNKTVNSFNEYRFKNSGQLIFFYLYLRQVKTNENKVRSSKVRSNIHTYMLNADR